MLNLPPYMKLWSLLTAALCIVLCFPACKGPAPAGENKPPHVVATTGMIADAVTAIMGDAATVACLMGPGVDPHLYKAAPSDLGELRRADLIVYNGLHLEGKMNEVFEQLSRSKAVYALASGIPEDRLLRSGEGAYDPHIWFDVALWRTGIAALADTLAERFPRQAAGIRVRADAYLAALDSLDAEVQAALSGIPESGRVLITAHDAFSYFGRAYQIEVRGLQGISTVAEFGLRDVSSLVEFIVARRIKAVFLESSVPPQAIEAVMAGCRQRGHNVNIGGTLYSDAMGAAGTEAGTYTGMVRANVNAMVKAL